MSRTLGVLSTAGPSSNVSRISGGASLAGAGFDDSANAPVANNTIAMNAAPRTKLEAITQSSCGKFREGLKRDVVVAGRATEVAAATTTAAALATTAAATARRTVTAA